ncbi:hypothetical protein A2962_03080 [Candidatus Woesebacteria bacterium RIFCSPLOWO2_01_FULL_39_61]|uniref:Uncharacterized protein n=1 Tax=Candidatus Woesebacteria bacterium RIFCSPHIGHO2_02_FULL_39_13 TaxID=1802505 RepID=A0A1F7Z0R9_9BACT|nr:MAG: hypothetical protein A2692_05960 [Candidatus Woesebacteria bacterium RIFCSPHIGHO2_01_FULL_39_95]OGM33161.1 MAG: hypothetical protein A3D01_04460 [Candidatus Woesebacteria bacterium RIFCSPHIGHO2_02_FULL_39_13]OGM36340.1 MAG: hypothetical protein A3E13_02800 [Candidatus Woesebacteria bacterium RIFCSPHIGHO2_12_FULL_40_20]OGM68402.1 MAG: hypothetical protein A2962_03080 [Candidatus Woesebacteria bacterium RIFCSPLOWO2_01_FULL_39_61]OGM74711.1 MAG: hypothetical protein A3H19_05915 [Candidatus
MSKIFYDHLIIIEEIDFIIRNAAESSEEKEELWKLVDEIIHHRILERILNRLPEKRHKEFLERFHLAPHDESHILYLQEKTGEDIEKIIKKEVNELEKELLSLVKAPSR